MLVIGHRGARGLKPENTIASLRTGLDLGVDIIEFDVRLTKDKIPILSHDPLMLRIHHDPRFISMLTLSELQKRTGGGPSPIVTLEAALKECVGKVMINIEIKTAAAVPHALPLIEKYVKKKGDWEQFIFSSFSTRVLTRVRKAAPYAQLALLHRLNPLLFLQHYNKLNLVAVGFHRLHINSFVLALTKKLKLFTYVYTVNRPEAAIRLAERGVDAVVTDRPDLILDVLAE
ncbi:glycerophosphodiester phosphodiesterase [Candidatus Saccharibacteria bacterium]|nr:glycerophosphodiester phosphodiesterase [Candidatus Saccharibacteria bacterium]